MKFLMGLNEAYEATKKQVLMLKPLPDIEEVFSMVCQDEHQRILKPVTNVLQKEFNIKDLGSLGYFLLLN